jgi:hypothetical protein
MPSSNSFRGRPLPRRGHYRVLGRIDLPRRPARCIRPLPAVRIDFTPSGSQAWDAMAGKYLNQEVAIVVDNQVEAAP